MRKIALILALVLGVALGVGTASWAAARIVFYLPAWGLEQGEKVVTLFEKDNPDVKVEIIKGPSTWDEHVGRTSLWVRTKYAGVDVLYEDDVFTLDGAYAGVWEDLTPYLSEEEINDLADLQKEYIKIHGGIYRIPWWNGMRYGADDFFFGQKRNVDHPVKRKECQNGDHHESQKLQTAFPDSPSPFHSTTLLCKGPKTTPVKPRIIKLQSTDVAIPYSYFP